MELTENDLLEHEVLNQIEKDFDDRDYDAISEMLQFLIKNESAKKVLIEYLGDEAKESWLEGQTERRY